MKRIKLIILVVLCFVYIRSNAQQAPYYTQYSFNDYLINPAVAGTYNQFRIRTNSRIQWLGINESPRTMSISGYGPLKEKPMGYGGYIFNDVTGPESRLCLGGSYAYNIAINDSWRISGGLSLGLMQYKLDGTALINDDEGAVDPVMTGGVESRIIPDANIGFYAYTTFYFVGISAHQLLGNKYNVYAESDTVKGASRLTQHVYLAGGANFILNRDFLLRSTAFIKYTAGQFQAEISALAFYQRMVWAGLSYRTGDAVSVMAGYKYNGRMLIGLAYDLTVSDMRRYSKGTIEVMIGFQFNDIK